MGLDTTHDCWHGPYSAFGRWREGIARMAGIPLGLMEGFCGETASYHSGGVLREALGWAAPREGGPTCRSHLGPVLHSWIERASEWLPIKWESLRPDILHVLLNHSDCDGSIPAYQCGPLADRLEELFLMQPADPEGCPGMEASYMRQKTRAFIDGLRRASEAEEDVEFH